MKSSDVMKCRFCTKYIGNKIDLEDYFFWCNKECHDGDIKEQEEFNLISNKPTTPKVAVIPEQPLTKRRKKKKR